MIDRYCYFIRFFFNLRFIRFNPVIVFARLRIMTIGNPLRIDFTILDQLSLKIFVVPLTYFV